MPSLPGYGKSKTQSEVMVKGVVPSRISVFRTRDPGKLFKNTFLRQVSIFRSDQHYALPVGKHLGLLSLLSITPGSYPQILGVEGEWGVTQRT